MATQKERAYAKAKILMTLAEQMLPDGKAPVLWGGVETSYSRTPVVFEELSLLGNALETNACEYTVLTDDDQWMLHWLAGASFFETIRGLAREIRQVESTWNEQGAGAPPIEDILDLCEQLLVEIEVQSVTQIALSEGASATLKAWFEERGFEQFAKIEED